MISSPGCLCRTNGASGPSSTRFWMTARRGTLRSCSWRSVRTGPGPAGRWPVRPSQILAWSLASGVAQPVDGRRCRLPDRPECRANLAREELGLFPGGEVASAGGLVVVHEGRIAVQDPAARRLEDLAGEGAEGDRNPDRRRGLAAAERSGACALPIGAGRRDAGAGQPVERDVVEDVVAGES